MLQSSKPNENNLVTEFNIILETIGTFRKNLSTLQNQLKTYEKNVNKEMKNLYKQAEKNKQKGNRKPSGFAKPSKISDELCNFLKVPKKSELARTDVTKRIISYIKDNKLENEENKKIIKCDDNLKKLLKCNDEEVTYFNIQRFMNTHFIKSQPATLSFE